MAQSKIQVKVQQDDGFVWTHFCYVSVGLKNQFDRRVNTLKWLSNHWIAQWAYEDFELMTVDTPEGLAALKDRIKEKYRERYPQLYLETNTDRQGWLRVWYTEHMTEELTRIGN